MPPPHEARVNKACVRCRASKRRCDGVRPQCGVCCSLGVECHFSTVRIPRGPPKGFRAAGPEGVRAKLVRTLETTLRDLVVKLGQDDAESELARLVELRGIRLGQGTDTALRRPRSPSRNPAALASYTASTQPAVPGTGSSSAPGCEPGPSTWHTAPAGSSNHAASSTTPSGSSCAGSKRSFPALPDTFPPSKHIRRSTANGQHISGHASAEGSSVPATPAQVPAGAPRSAQDTRSDILRPQSLSPTQAFTPMSPRSSQSGLVASDLGQSHRERYDGDTLGVTGQGDTLHLGSSSGLQLLSGRTLPPLPGRGPSAETVSLPFGGLTPLLHPRRRSIGGSRRGSSRVTSPTRALSSHRTGSIADASGHPSYSPASAMHLNTKSDQGRLEYTDFASSQHPLPHHTAFQAPDKYSSHGMSTIPNRPKSAHITTALPHQYLRLPRAPSYTTKLDDLEMNAHVSITVQECRRWWGLYWKGFHPLWPILYKSAIRDIPAEVVHEHLEPCVLYAIYAVSSCIAVPGKQSQEDSPERQNQLAKGRVFYYRAEEYIYAARLHPSLSTVQTVFLLAIYSHGTGDLSQAWLYHSLSVSMALDMGLHRWPIDRYDLLYDDNERESRVRLIWLIYVLGLQLASAMGRPVHLKRSDIDMPFLSETEEDDIELVDLDKFDSSDDDTTSTAAGVAVGPRRLHVAQCTNLCIPLFTILEGILFQFHSYGRKEALRKRKDEVQSLVEKFDQDLDRWHAGVPAPFRADEMLARLQHSRHMDPVPLPAFFAVELWFYTAKILLHRNFIPQEEGVSLADLLANNSFREATQAAQVIADMLEAASGCLQVFDLLSADTSYCFFTAAVMCIFASRLRDKEVALHAQRGYTLCRDALARASDIWATASGHSKLLDGFSYLSDSIWDDQSQELAPPPVTGAPAGRRKSVIPLKSLESGGRTSSPHSSTDIPNPDLHPPADAPTHASGARSSISLPAPGGNWPHDPGPRAALNCIPPPEQQREHMLQWFEQSEGHVPGPSTALANSAQLYAPGLFDLEHVFFNECPGIGNHGALPPPVDPAAAREPHLCASGFPSGLHMPLAVPFVSDPIFPSPSFNGSEPSYQPATGPCSLPSMSANTVASNSNPVSDSLRAQPSHAPMISSAAFNSAAHTPVPAPVADQWVKSDASDAPISQLHTLSQHTDYQCPPAPASMTHLYELFGGLGYLGDESADPPSQSMASHASATPAMGSLQASRHPPQQGVADSSGPSQVHNLLALLQLPPSFNL